MRAAPISANARSAGIESKHFFFEKKEAKNF
jgi:hypothetical protein